MGQVKINLGCGSVTPAGWINVDWAMGARFAKIPLFKSVNAKLKIFNMDWSDGIVLRDLTKPFPWENDSADIFYSSHTLEHFDRDRGRAFLRECFRVLKSEGVIRIVVPDLARVVDEYASGNLLADRFVERLGVAYQEAADGPIKKRLGFLIRYPHLCMYDSASLLAALKEVGFEARERTPFDSAIDDIDRIEVDGRTKGSVIVEGIKPIPMC